MRTYFVICGLLALSAATPPSTRFPDDARGMSGDDTCAADMADPAGLVLDNIYNIPDLPPVPLLQPENQHQLIAISERLFGLNLFDDQARGQAFCNLAQVETVEQLKAAFPMVNFGAFRGVYDYLVLGLPLALSDYPEQLTAIYKVLERLGLTSLDTAGTQWWLDITGTKHMYMADIASIGYESSYSPVQPPLEEKCSTLQELVTQMLDEIKEDDPAVAAILATEFESWTGIDLNVVEQRNALLCDIAGVSSIQELFDTMDENGLIENLYRKGYPLLASFVKTQLDQLQQSVELFDDYVSDLGRHADFIEASHHDRVRARRQSAPGHGDPTADAIQLHHIFKLALEFLQAVEANGLLDLPLKHTPPHLNKLFGII